MRYISVKQAAAAWDVNPSRVRQWLLAGRIRGALKLGRDWAIPAKAYRPAPLAWGELRRRRKPRPKDPISG